VKLVDIYPKYDVQEKKSAGVAMQTLKGMQLVDAIGNHCKKQSVALMRVLRNEMLLLQHYRWGRGERNTRPGCRHRI
jgi:hypothetical protein